MKPLILPQEPDLSLFHPERLRQHRKRPPAIQPQGRDGKLKRELREEIETTVLAAADERVAALFAAHPHVEKFYPPGDSEGGTGATIVEMKG